MDIIYVGGGNTRSMLAVWREWGVDDILRDAWQNGTILCGPSAGAICWFEQGTTDSLPGSVTPVTGLGFLSGSCCPHYDGEPMRRPAYLRMIGDGTLKDGYALDDFVGILVRGDKVVEVISARTGARAYYVQRQGGEVIETPLDPTVVLELCEGHGSR
jgi:peptidase E